MYLLEWSVLAESSGEVSPRVAKALRFRLFCSAAVSGVTVSFTQCCPYQRRSVCLLAARLRPPRPYLLSLTSSSLQLTCPTLLPPQPTPAMPSGPSWARHRSPTPPPSHFRRHHPRTPSPPRRPRRRSPSPSRRSYSYRDDYRRRSRDDYDWDNRYARRYRRSDTPSPPPRRRRRTRSPSPDRYRNRDYRSHRTRRDRSRSPDHMYATTERPPIRFFDSSRNPAVSLSWRAHTSDVVSVPLGASSYGIFDSPKEVRGGRRGTYDEMDNEEGELGRSRGTARGGAVKLKRKAPEMVGASRINEGLVEKRMKQEAEDAMEMDEEQFEQRYDHGGKARGVSKRSTKDDSRWEHDWFDPDASASLVPPTPSCESTPAALKVHVGAATEDPACKGMAVASPDKATFGSTVVDSASDKARRFLDAMRLTKPFKHKPDSKTAHEGRFRSGLEGSKILLISPSASPSGVDEPTGFRRDGPLAEPAIPNRQIQRDIIAASRPPPVFLGPLPSDLTRVELVSLLAPYDVVDWTEVGQTDEQGHRTETMVLQVEMKEDEGKEAIEFDAKEGVLRCRGRVVKVLEVEKRKKELAKAKEVGQATAAPMGQFDFPARSVAFRLRGGGVTSEESSTTSEKTSELTTRDMNVDTLAADLTRTTRLESHVPDDPVSNDFVDEQPASRISLSPTPFGLTSPRSQSLTSISRSATPASPRYTPPSHWIHPERIKSPWAYLGEHDADPYAEREKEIEREMDQEVRVCIDRRKERLVLRRVETLDLTADSDEEDSDGMSVNA
ncbi:hypothetical protein AAT19DRAFT_11431 [Rhodotorula toruloides]|uniref:RRM domain-containing protein n=2 Tax=Rhodotorula toruloides TaxID=5286 RepID=A0A2S9ZWS1_RHOTO|nr:hypothetical protein AAT19DRAFT_11431 [Rhodotorula toruloides]